MRATIWWGERYSRVGMTAGCYVGGIAGDFAGHRMRRGEIRVAVMWGCVWRRGGGGTDRCRWKVWRNVATDAPGHVGLGDRWQLRLFGFSRHRWHWRRPYSGFVMRNGRAFARDPSDERVVNEDACGTISPRRWSIGGIGEVLCRVMCGSSAFTSGEVEGPNGLSGNAVSIFSIERTGLQRKGPGRPRTVALMFLSVYG